LTETGEVADRPETPAERKARLQRERRARARAEAKAQPKAKMQPKAKAKAKARAKAKAKAKAKRAPRRIQEAQIVNAAPSSFVEPPPSVEPPPPPTPVKKRITKKGGSISNRIEEIIEASKLPPAEQALLPKKHLTTKVARPKKGQKKKNGGIEPILEHNDVQDDPYYMKPPLQTHVK
jgi:hypothetical protein